MADTKISALSAAAALGGTEEIPGVQSAANVKLTPAQIKTYTSASPTLFTPVLGVATATSINKVAITAPATSATLAIADGQTLTVSASATISGTPPSLSAANTFTAAQTIAAEDAGTNTVLTAATVRRTSSGTPANGIGVGLNFEVETAAGAPGNTEIGGQIACVTSDVNAASEDFFFSYRVMIAGAAVTETGRLGPNGFLAIGQTNIASYGFIGDEGTGMARRTAATLSLMVGSSEKVRLDGTTLTLFAAGFILDPAASALVTRNTNSQVVTLSTSGATTLSTNALVPGPGRLLSLMVRVNTAVSGPTSLEISFTGGANLVKIGTANASLGTLTAGSTYVLVPAAFADGQIATANTVTITAVGGTPSAGALRLISTYEHYTVPGS